MSLDKKIKHIFFLVLLLSFTSNSFAKTKKYDLNKDGVIDRTDYWNGKTLLKRQEDRNGDGKVDFEVVYFNTEKIKEEKSDTNYDGHFDRIKTFEKFQKKYVRVLYQVDKDFDQKFEREYYETFELDQKDQTDCIQELKVEIDNFVSNGIAAVAGANEGFLPTNFGYSVDQECLQDWGNNFPTLLEQTIQTGLQCMSRLHESLSSPSTLTAGLRNSKDLVDLLSTSPVTVVCSEEEGYNWEGIAGHASTSPERTMTSPSVQHPFISINPKGPEVTPANSDELYELKRTIFHENLHNLGYRHGEGLEFPYACEGCCFPKESHTDREKILACKICNGDYPSEDSLEYLNDFVEYSDISYRMGQSYRTLRRSLKETPADIDRLTLLAITQGDVFNPIGFELAKIISENNQLSPYQESNLVEARKYAPIEGRQSGAIVAQAMYEIYVNQDATAAIELITNNKDMMKAELDLLKNSTTDSTHSYIADSIEEALDETIFEVWINKYGNGAENLSMQSHELNTFFELL